MWVIAKVRLGGDTRRITTKTGTRMQTAFGFADVDNNSAKSAGEQHDQHTRQSGRGNKCTMAFFESASAATIGNNAC